MRARKFIAVVAAGVGMLTATGSHAEVDENLVGHPIDRYQETHAFGANETGPLDGLLESLRGVDSTNYATVRSTDRLIVKFRRVSSERGGVVGIEHSLIQSGVNGGNSYLPCKNPNDTYKRACVNISSPSYWITGNWDAGDGIAFPDGVQQFNISNTSTCPAAICRHGWADRTRRMDFEMYPKLSSGITDLNYVRPRFAIGESDLVPVPKESAYETVEWGTVPAPALGSAGTGKINGYVYTASGSPTVPKDTLRFSIFQKNTDAHTPKTSTGKLITSFYAGGHSQGFWSSGAVFSGVFRVKLQDTRPVGEGSTAGKCYLLDVSVASMTGVRVDFSLDKTDLGRSDVIQVSCGV